MFKFKFELPIEVKGDLNPLYKVEKKLKKYKIPFELLGDESGEKMIFTNLCYCEKCR